ncbi:hypothetical protein FGG08_003053 [Glutinoglossum americanum]|uniref:Uncharacterized protein n=1 Tax=Glutinoglossum americanum TaxID=1670608 RepID=A0A9P8IBT2_9PEZI|nr:hypothetical protein FGG08_003053 [Glutinoglossum americanum]
MDPAAKTLVIKYRNPKPLPTKQLDSLQVKLKNNPYARALATPVRCCSILQARLPSFFLTCYRLVAHPETELLWYLPQGLTKPPQWPRDSIATEQPSLSSPPDGPSSYALSSASLLQQITSTPRKQKTFTWHQLGSRQHLKPLPDIIWRQDMHEFVLRLLRKRVWDEAKHMAVQRSRCATLEEVQWKKQVGFVLWFGRPPGKHTDSSTREVGDGPAKYATIVTRRPTTKAAVYNLPRLLGHELTGALRKIFELEPHNEAVVVKLRRSTAPAVMWLWKLEGYLAGFEKRQED